MRRAGRVIGGHVHSALFVTWCGLAELWDEGHRVADGRRRRRRARRCC